MHLNHLSLTHFRNFARLDLPLPRKNVLLIGDNAQGKTSLLEAIYLLSTLTSFQTNSIWQMVNFLAARQNLSVGRIVGAYTREDGEHRLELRLILENNGAAGRNFRREVLLDGVKKNINAVIGHFKAVLFIPQMSQIIEGTPNLRRRYMNLTLAQAIPAYAQTLADYRQALTQRNALLKNLSARRGDSSQLDYWDRLLAEKGARLMKWRIQALRELEDKASWIQHELTGGNEVLRLDYLPSYEPLPRPAGQFNLPLDAPIDRSRLEAQEIASGLEETLKARRAESIARGVTFLGPHRDDLRILANGIDLGHYGSRGQIRTALLALKLAEVDWIQMRTGEWPLILLDEVMAELDRRRQQNLLSHLASRGQVLITATQYAIFSSSYRSQAQVWQVADGIISPYQEERTP